MKLFVSLCFLFFACFAFAAANPVLYINGQGNLKPFDWNPRAYCNESNVQSLKCDFKDGQTQHVEFQFKKNSAVYCDLTVKHNGTSFTEIIKARRENNVGPPGYSCSVRRINGETIDVSTDYILIR